MWNITEASRKLLAIFIHADTLDFAGLDLVGQCCLDIDAFLFPLAKLKSIESPQCQRDIISFL
jgi:hypothetical protein